MSQNKQQGKNQDFIFAKLELSLSGSSWSCETVVMKPNICLYNSVCCRGSESETQEVDDLYDQSEMDHLT